MPSETELADLARRRSELRDQYLLPAAERSPTPGRGIHHAALICSDVEQTIGFYQGLLGFPLVELVEPSRFVPHQGVPTPVPDRNRSELAAGVLPAGDPAAQ